MKKPISATIDVELIKWIAKELQDRKTYRNKSHLIEIALDSLKNSKEIFGVPKNSKNFSSTLRTKK